MKKIAIGNKKIGEGERCFVVAEAGINHNGDMDLARKMIDAAKECGADAIKFQTFKANEFVGDKKKTYTYETQGKKARESMFEMFKRYEFSKKQFRELAGYCKRKDIIFFSTPQNISDLELLLDIGVPVIKVGSDDLTNLPLMRNYARRKLPMLISTGMSYLSEIAEAVETIEKINDQIVIFYCVSSYPADPKEVNLNRIRTLTLAFPNAIIGFSDHTIGSVAAVGAVVLGVMIIEKHFTLDRNLFGPDHRFSADPQEFKQLVWDVRNIEYSLGTTAFSPSLSEQKMRGLARRSVVAKRNIRRGKLIDRKDLACKRPGIGIAPRNLDFVIGRKAKSTILKDQLIKQEDLG